MLMIKPEVIEFCEDYKISIRKFLQENYSIIPSSSTKRYRIRHKEIAGFANLIPVSMFFAYRYPELVASGKLVVVEDDYHKFNVYINPRIIGESLELQELEDQLNTLYEDTVDNLIQINLLLRKIAELKENITLINHFHGIDEEIKAQSLFQKGRDLGLTRERKKT